MRINKGVTVKETTFYPQLEVGPVATTFESPTFERFTYNLGGNYYGGTFDWNTGELTINKKYMALEGNEALGNSLSGSAQCIWLNHALTDDMAIGDYLDGYCSHFYNERKNKNVNTIRFGSSADKTIYLYLPLNKFADASAFNAYAKTQYDAGTPIQIVYPTEPKTIQLFDYAKNIKAFDGLNIITTEGHTSTVIFNAPNQATVYSAGNGLTLSGTAFNIGAGTGISVTADTVGLATSGVTAGKYGPSKNVAGDNGNTMNVPEITVDEYGRVTNITNRVYTAKNNTYTIPTTLKNPNSLTVYGNTTKCFDYDGSAVKTLTIKPGSNIKVTGDTNGNITIDNTYSYSLPAASSSLGGVKTTSTVTSNAGLTACPIIDGVVYYKDTNTQLGTTSSTAYRGDYGAEAYAHGVTNKGFAFNSGLYKITTNNEGHVTGATTVEKSDITALGIPEQNTTYSAGTGLTLTNTTFSVSSANVSAMINLLDEGPSQAQLDDYLIAQHVGGGTTTTSYYRRKVRNVVNAAVVKAALGTGTNTNKFLRDDGTWQTVSAGTTSAVASCDTAASDKAKTASITTGTFSLATGTRVTVKFTNANSVTDPTLNIDSTGAKPIYWHGTALVSSQYWQAGAVLDFVYNGTQWDLIGIAKDTTYSAAKHNILGLVKPAYTSTGAATLTTVAASNTTAPTIAAKTTTTGRYYAVEADKNGVLFVNVPWSDTDNDTHYTTKIYAGASGATSNAIMTNPYLTVVDSTTYRNQVRFMGSGATTVTSDANGNITISSPSTMGAATASANGTSGLVPAPTKGKQASFLRGDGTWATPSTVNVTLGATTKAYLLGTSTTPTSTATGVTTIADTGVYLDTIAGSLTASRFVIHGTRANYQVPKFVISNTQPTPEEGVLWLELSE